MTKPIKIAYYIAEPSRDCCIDINGSIISAVHANGTEGMAWGRFTFYNMGKKTKKITVSVTRNTIKFSIKSVRNDR